MGSGIGADERYIARIVTDVQTSGEFEKISQGAPRIFSLFRHLRAAADRPPCRLL